MLDSYGKIPNGLLSGSISALGDYDQCLNVVVPKSTTRGQYCAVEVQPPLPPREAFVPFDVMIPEFVNITESGSITSKVLETARIFYRFRLRTTVCVPSVCSRKEVEQIAEKVVASMNLGFEVTVPNCETKNVKTTFDSTETYIIVLLTTLLLVAIIATLVDIALRWCKKNPEKIGTYLKFLLCFSLYKNLQKLLKEDTSPDSIKIFHGMKTIALLWVLLCHTYLFTNYYAMSGVLEMKDMVFDFVFQVVINGFLCVEIFFFISAVLSAYGVMKMKQKNINVLLYIFRRLWRLTPPFMLIIACVLILPHLGSGPVWKETVTDPLAGNCRNHWWTNLAYVNNFVSIHKMCLRWSWYIPVDTQLYIVSLAVLIPLKRNARLGLMMNGLLLCIGIVTSAVFHLYYKLQPTTVIMYIHKDDIAYASDYGYHRPYLHCGTFCVGLTVGYILATKPNIRIPLWASIAGWCTAVVLGVGVVYGAYDWKRGNLPGTTVSTLYASMGQLLFAVALAWVTIACVYGRGGIVSSFLRWPGFVPLGRLTYMTYLVHPLVIYAYIGSARDPIRHNHRTLVFLYLGNVLMSFMCSLLLSLLFESPFLGLEKLMMSSRYRNDDDRTGKERLQHGTSGDKSCIAISLKNKNSF